MRLLVASMKGGSGKSTIAFNLAVWLTYRVRELTLTDLDPQATLSDVCELREELGYGPGLTCQVGLGDGVKAGAYAVYDTSFTHPDLLRAAMWQADAILLPVGPSQADVWSAQRFLETLGTGAIPPVKALINRADTHHAIRESDQAAEALKQLDGLSLLEARLYQRTAYRRSLSEGLSVFELDPNSKASAEIETLAATLFPELREA